MNPEEIHNSLVLVYATLLLIAFIGQKKFYCFFGICVILITKHNNGKL